MRAGRLRETVTIQTAAESQDSYGQAEKTWSGTTTRRAEVKPMFQSAESPHGGKYEGRAMFQFTMRYIDIDQAARLVYDSRNFEIVEVINKMERDRETIIKAVESE